MYRIFFKRLPIITLFVVSFCLTLFIALTPIYYPDIITQNLPNLLSKSTVKNYRNKTSNLGTNLNGIADWSTELRDRVLQPTSAGLLQQYERDLRLC